MSSVRTLSTVTGLTYLSMIPFGILGILYIPNALIVPGDVAATAEAIRTHLPMFHIGILSGLTVQLIQIALVLLLYRLLGHASKTAGILMIAFILPAVSISMLNEVHYLAISSLVRQPLTEGVQQLIAMLLEMHRAGVMIAQIFWGIWLFPMGYLVYRSGYVPRVIGVLLMIGCFGYVTDSLLYILGIDPGFTVSEYTFLGEVLLPLWLIIRAKAIAQKHPGILPS